MTDHNSLPKLLKSLSEEELKEMDKKLYEVSYRTGETIFKQGGAFTHIIYLTKGRAKILLEDRNKPSVIVKILNPFELTGGPGFNTDYRHHYTVVSLTETKVGFIEASLFKDFCISNPTFALELIRFINYGFIELYDRILSISNKHMSGRLADTLLCLSEKVYKQDEFKTELTRSDIANMSGMTKESTIRTLKSLSEDKIIENHGNSFKILKKNSLRELSEKG